MKLGYSKLKEAKWRERARWRGKGGRWGQAGWTGVGRGDIIEADGRVSDAAAQAGTDARYSKVVIRPPCYW